MPKNICFHIWKYGIFVVTEISPKTLYDIDASNSGSNMCKNKPASQFVSYFVCSTVGQKVGKFYKSSFAILLLFF